MGHYPVHPQISRRHMLLGGVAMAAAIDVPGHPAKAAPEPSSSITIAVGDSILGLDPTDLNDSLSLSATRLFYQGLYGFDEKFQLQPVLAESAEADAEGKHHTIRLRGGIRFHDGSEFNAQAVKINYDRLRDPANHLKRQGLLEMVEAVEVVDPLTLRITLKNPSGVLLNYLAHSGASIISPRALEQYGKEISQHPVGTGPFRFESWRPDLLKASRNADYWKPELPRLSAISIRSIPENGARIAALRAGEVQYIFPLPPETVALLNTDKRVAVDKTSSIVAHYVALNTRQKPLDDRRVRQALNYAIDKEAFIRVVYSGFATPMDAPMAPGIAFHTRQGVWPYDPAKARQLLAEAGLANGFETEIWTFSNTLNNRASQFLQQQLAAVGVKVKVTPLEAGVATAKLWGATTPEQAEVRMFYGSWAPSTGDADWALRPLLSSQSYPPSLYNIAYFQNGEVDAALARGLATTDSAARKAAYDEVQRIVWEEAPWIFLSVDTLLAGRDQRLTGLVQLPDTSLSYENATLG
ncbi:glutathione ABC transporter substrate-binding protein [Roseomonas elaeocarpi]|uniref:Glutathione-binding protein GsiB n=1 Tax=Roseomonas elaeocarpi TaxID=907779 RepID=A0ABV6JPT7_9PROT